LTCLSKFQKATNEFLRQSLESVTAILGPRGVQAKAAPLYVHMLYRQIAKLVRPQTRHEGRFVQQATMGGTRCQEVRDFLGCHSPSVACWRCIKWSKGLQWVVGQITTLDAPIAERSKGLGVVGESLASAPLVLEATKLGLNAR